MLSMKQRGAEELSEDFWRRVLTQSVRQAAHVGHSLDMVGELPGAYDSSRTGIERVACLEAFLIHVRLLAEFLLVHPTKGMKDFSAGDFGWNGPTDRDTSLIDRMWRVASQHLVHFSRERTPEHADTLEAVDTTAVGLKSTALQTLDLADDFVVFLECKGDMDAHVFRSHLEKALTTLEKQPQLSSPPCGRFSAPAS
jgi:hypothetical protein